MNGLRHGLAIIAWATASLLTAANAEARTVFSQSGQSDENGYIAAAAPNLGSGTYMLNVRLGSPTALFSNYFVKSSYNFYCYPDFVYCGGDDAYSDIVPVSADGQNYSATFVLSPEHVAYLEFYKRVWSPDRLMGTGFVADRRVIAYEVSITTDYVPEPAMWALMIWPIVRALLPTVSMATT